MVRRHLARAGAARLPAGGAVGSESIVSGALGKNWVDAPGFPAPPAATDVGGERSRPGKPQGDVWIYSVEDIPPLLPRPPGPYRTVSDTFSY